LNDSAEQIAQTISRHAVAHPKRDAIIFLERGEAETERVTYEDLEARVTSYAAGVESEGLGSRVVAIAMPAGPAFISLFLGCLRAGAIAGGAAPRSPSSGEEGRSSSRRASDCTSAARAATSPTVVCPSMMRTSTVP